MKHHFFAHLQSLTIITCILLITACGSQSNKPSQQALDNALPKLQQQLNEWRGVPYLYGGSSKSGIDCSAFVQNTFAKQFNIQLARTTKAQRKQTTLIDMKHLKAGDLLFFKTGFKVWHVGIYISGGKFMHASTSKGVTTSNLKSSYWYNAFVDARRIN